MKFSDIEPVTEPAPAAGAVAAFRATAEAIEGQVGEAIVGQRSAVRGVLISLVLGQHALLEGVPGLGKTSMVRAFSWPSASRAAASSSPPT